MTRVLFALLLCAGAATAVDVERDIPYAVGQFGASPDATEFETRPLLLDVYRPKGPAATPRPALVMLHGGGFTRGSKEHRHLTALAEYLAARGYVCFPINYRLLDAYPPAPPPFHMISYQRTVHAAAVDAKAAVRFVRANHARFGVDPDRIGILGDSAGAIASIAAGVTDDDRFLADTAGGAPPPENHPGVPSRPAVIVDLWGSGEIVMDAFDPGDPPMLIVHGTEDDHIGVFFSAALSLKAACERHGIPHRFVPVEGAKHGAWREKVDGKGIAEIVHAFLEDFLAAR